MFSKNTKLSAPETVDLMITGKCNLRCLHCSASQDQFESEDMTTEELLLLINELAACQVFKITLTGGEPFIHPDFFEIAEAVLENPMRVNINTNATLVSDEIISKLKKLKRSPFISVSLDGMTPRTHDAIRGKGSFAKATNGIRLLSEAGFTIRPFVVVSAINCLEINEILAFSNDIKVTEVFLSTPVFCGRARLYENDFGFTEELLCETLENISVLLDKYPNKLRGPFVEYAKFYQACKKRQHSRLRRFDYNTPQKLGA